MRIQDLSGGVFSRAIILVVLASLLFSGGWAQDLDHRQRPTEGSPSSGGPPTGTKDRIVKPASTTPESLTALNSALESLAAKASQGVVQILVTGYGPIEDSGRTDAALIARQKAIGSGVVVDPSGYVVTNAHVVEGAQRIRVVLPVPAAEGAVLEPEGKRRILEAKLVGVHQESDLALLKVTAKDLPTLPLGTGRRVHQGQLVLAIGSPEGLQGTVTMGVVSSVARQPDRTKLWSTSRRTRPSILATAVVRWSTWTDMWSGSILSSFPAVVEVKVWDSLFLPGSCNSFTRV
jgi:S1-C subfamily serine protease